MNGLTLGEIKPIIARVLNMCQDDERIIEYVNEAIQRINARGLIKEKYKVVALNHKEGYLTYPPDIVAIEKLSVGNKIYPLKNKWYEFLSDSYGYRNFKWGNFKVEIMEREASPFYRELIKVQSVLQIVPSSVSDNGKTIFFGGAYDTKNERLLTRNYIILTLSDNPIEGDEIVLGGEVFKFVNENPPTNSYEISIGENTFDTVNNIYETLTSPEYKVYAEKFDYYILIKARANNEVSYNYYSSGDKANFSYYDENGVFRIRKAIEFKHKIYDGVYEYITYPDYIVRRNFGVHFHPSKIEYIIKPITNGTITINQVVGDIYNNPSIIELVKLNPKDRYIKFKHAFINNWGEIGDKTLFALCKVGIQKIEFDDELLPINNLGAIKLAVQAILKEENNQIQDAINYWKLAEYEMLKDHSYSKPDFVPVSINIDDNAKIKGIGRML